MYLILNMVTAVDESVKPDNIPPITPVETVPPYQQEASLQHTVSGTVKQFLKTVLRYILTVYFIDFVSC